MRRERQALILKLISQTNIATQEELLNMLLESGVRVTQATVSRDIKDLGLIKRPAANGSYKYCAGSEAEDEATQKYHAIFAQSAIFVDNAGHMCVVKCRVGTANAACAALDSMNWSDIVGTLAGDDTIFILCRTSDTALKTREAIEKMLG